MAKRSVSYDDGERLEIDEEEYSPKVVEIVLPPSTTQKVVLLIDSLTKIQGAVTKEIYVFNGAGSVVDVDERDVPALLGKKLGRGCCNPTPSHYFELV